MVLISNIDDKFSPSVTLHFCKVMFFQKRKIRDFAEQNEELFAGYRAVEMHRMFVIG